MSENTGDTDGVVRVELDDDLIENDASDSGSDNDSDDSSSGSGSIASYRYVPRNCNFGDEYPIIEGDDLSPFPHPYVSDAWSNVYCCPITLEEQAIQAASEAIRRKPEWWRKVDDDEIAAKWKNEMIEQGIREVWADYIIREIKEVSRPWVESLEYKAGPILTREIVQGDGLVSDDVKQQLQSLVKSLLEENNGEPDWHPGSDEQVLDLVHPSLFPVVYGKTRILKPDQPNLKFELGSSDGLFPSLDNCVVAPEFNHKTDMNKNDVADYAISKKYQWLPTPFEVDGEGKVNIKSYINNLHPQWHKDLYPLISKVFESALPALEHTLSAFMSGQMIRINANSHSNGFYSDEDPDFEDEDGEFDDAAWEAWHESRVIAENNPKDELPHLKHKFEAKGKTFNVITKLANIHLTPEKPSYPGGTWHVEGTINENIVATILYYYDMDNITDSRLSFRASIADPDYPQGDERGVRLVYGLEDEQLMVANLGSIEAQEDRVVVFPNIYQHHVDPFELKDKSKPGHRKIVCFFVCDPHDKKIHTTARVPPQNSTWWGDKVRSVGLLDKLPDELFNKVMDAHDDYPWSLESAKAAREDLMKERSNVVKEQNTGDHEEGEGMFGREFSLCEH